MFRKSGAGLFGALQHVDLTAIAEMRERRGYDMDEDDEELSDMEEEPEWKKDRITLENDLEKELETTPFETYKLFRGKKGSITGVKQVGVFKGLIRIKLDNNASNEIFGEDLLKQLLKPKGYNIRLYLLEAKGLTPMVIEHCTHSHTYT